MKSQTIWKIKVTGTGKDPDFWGNREQWVNGCSTIPKVGGPGKSYTNPVLANRMYNQVVATPCHQRGDIRATIVEFELTPTKEYRGHVE